MDVVRQAQFALEQTKHLAARGTGVRGFADPPDPKGERSPSCYNTGWMLQKAGQLDDAMRLYREALQEPAFPEALLNLGHVLKGLGQQDEARDCWKNALEQKPELAQGYFEKTN